MDAVVFLLLQALLTGVAPSFEGHAANAHVVVGVLGAFGLTAARAPSLDSLKGER